MFKRQAQMLKSRRISIYKVNFAMHKIFLDTSLHLPEIQIFLTMQITKIFVILPLYSPKFFFEQRALDFSGQKYPIAALCLVFGFQSALIV